MNFVDSVLLCSFFGAKVMVVSSYIQTIWYLVVQLVCFIMVCVSSISLGEIGSVAHLTVD